MVKIPPKKRSGFDKCNQGRDPTEEGRGGGEGRGREVGSLAGRASEGLLKFDSGF